MSYPYYGMRVVLDTSVLVAGLRSRLGASNGLLMRVAEGLCIPLVTTAVFLGTKTCCCDPSTVWPQA